MASVPVARHLLRARDLADARYFEPLTVADMARMAGLSRSHFSERFKRAFGESPHAEMGNFRWLTVGMPGQPDFAVTLMAIPGPPAMDAATAEQVRDLMAKGFAGTVFFNTDDCQASYDEMTARGVEFTEKPERVPYGIDCAFHDPSGNHIRLVQPMP